MHHQMGMSHLTVGNQFAQMASIATDAIIKIGWLVGGAKARHIYCHRATELSHTARQNVPIQDRPRIAVHENHCLIGTGWSEFEQWRTYPVNDHRSSAHSPPS